MSHDSLERTLERGIFPLVATKNERLYPVGTAFCISKFGLLLTAEHNLREALIYHDRGDGLRAMDLLPNDVDMRGLGLSVIWKKVDESGGQMNLWPVEHIAGGPPTDVIFAFPQFQTEFPYQLFRLSFDVPRIGANARCVGYSDMPRDGLDFEEFQRNPQIFSNEFHCIEGPVKAVFINGFAKKFIEGPCAVVECDVRHAMSGGPVFDEAGHVWGIVSAGASEFFGHGATIVSLLYPLLFTPIKIGVRMGPLTLTGTNPFVSYIASGAVLSDGSEEGLNLHQEDGGCAVGPRIHREDREHVFANFAAFQERQPAEPFDGENWRIRINSPGRVSD